MTDLPDNFKRAMHKPTTLSQPCGRCHPCLTSRPRECVRFAKQRVLPNAGVPILATETGLERVLPEIPTAGSGKTILDVFLPCIPPAGTAQQKGVSVRNGKPFFFTKSEIRATEWKWRDILKPVVFSEPADGALALTLEFVYPWLKGEKKAVKERYSRIPKATAGDADNLSKIPVDLLTKKGAWMNDGQLAILHVEKWHGRTPGVRIKITTVDPVL